MADYVELLKRPFTDIKVLLIGAGLFLPYTIATKLSLHPAILGIFFLVSLFVIGYTIKVGKTAIDGIDTLPGFGKWGDLFVKGLLITVIGLIWMIPTMVLLFIFGGAAFFGTIALGGGIGTFAVAGIGMVVLAAVAFITVYLLGAAILNYAAKDKFGAAFEFGEIFKNALSGPYFIAWIMAVVLSMILSAILGFIPFIGPAFAAFVSTMWWMLLLGNAYGELK